MAVSSLNEQIWQIIAAVPRGKVVTYGQVARLAGYPRHARYVGTTLKNLPHGTRLPWYRVLNAQGRLSFPQGSEAYWRQRRLLEDEGVVFIGERISLREFGWDV